MATVTQR